MKNAKLEFLETIKGKSVLCADIFVRATEDDEDSARSILLPCGYTEENMEQCLDNLDFEYDDGYGCQMLHGVIWFTDDTWAERDEYDGSEWWRIVTEPEIPDYLLSK